jgi:hypothetical protein
MKKPTSIKLRLSLITLLAFMAGAGFSQAPHIVTNLEWVNNLAERDSRESVPSEVDQNGNIYSIGFTIQQGNKNAVLQKIDSSGNTVWIQYYDGTGSGDDKAYSLWLSDLGYIYVCGEATGNGTGKDFLTMKYDTSGALIWSAEYDGAGSGIDVAVGLVVDEFDNVYTAGRSTNASGNFDYKVVKYDGSGSFQWDYTYNGTASSDDRLRSIAICDSNRIYVTGYTTSTGASKDITTIRIDDISGTHDWVRTTNGSVSGSDEGQMIIMDGYDPVIVGHIINSGSNKNYYTAKLNHLNGNVTWSNTYDGFGNADVAYSIARNDSGQFGVTGLALNTNYEYHTVIYSNSGSQQFVNRYNINISAPNIAPKISLDTIANYFYVVGETQNGTPNTDVVLYQVNLTGVQGWLFTYNGTGNTIDVGVDLAVNSFGQIFVCAQTGSSSGYIDMTTFRVSQTPVYTPPDFSNELPDPKYCFYTNLGQIINTQDSIETSFNYYTDFITPEVYVDNNSYSYVFRKIDADTATTDTLERIDFIFYESSPYAQLYHFEEGPTRLNYYLPHCSTGVTNVKGYYHLMSPNLFPKIDLHYLSNKDGLKFYLGMKPWADTNRLQFRVQGGDTSYIDGSGNLRLQGVIGDVTLAPPHAYQVDYTGTIDTLTGSASWVQVSNNRYRISLPAINPAWGTVITVSNVSSAAASNATWQNLDYSSYVGTSGDDVAYDIKVDNQDNRYVAGITNSNIFPFLNAAFVQYSGAVDGFVQKYNSYDTLQASTYIGGTGYEYNYGIDVSNNGHVYIGGYTSSLNFPVKSKTGATNQLINANTTARSSNDDGFLAEFTNDVDTLIWARYVGGDHSDMIKAIDWDEQENTLLATGYTSSSNFNWGNWLMSVPHPGFDQILIHGKFNQNDSLLKGGSFVGINCPSGTVFTPNDILADDSLYFYICGYTNFSNCDNNSSNSNALFYCNLQGQYDGFILKMKKNFWLENLTMFGGVGRDYVNKIGKRSNGNIVFVGHTTKADSTFPIMQQTGSFNLASSSNTNEAFILEVDGQFNQLWTSFIGGDQFRDAVAYGIDVDNNDHLYVAGYTNTDSVSYGIWGNMYHNTFYWDSTNNSLQDGFITIIDAGNQIVHSTLFGGSADDKIFNVDVYNSEKLYCVGFTKSADFEYAYTGSNQGLIDSTFGGGTVNDGFVSRFDLVNGYAIGIKDVVADENSILYFPNPTTDYITLKTDGKEYKFLNLNIYDVMGKLVLSKRYNNQLSNIVIDLKQVAAGHYILQLSGENFSKSLKIIKQ